MGILLVILPLAGLILFIALLGGLPAKRRLALVVFMILWAVLMLGIGYTVGEVSPRYRGNIAVEQILREAAKTLEADQCERARAAFVEANQFLQKGGKTWDAVKLLRDRLQASTLGNVPASAPMVP